MRIRNYQPEDRTQVEKICADTGLRGHLDQLFCDRELFAKIWLAPYLDNEPENCFVAEDEGRVVGYIVCALHPQFQKRALRALGPHLLTMLRSTMAGRYRLHPESHRFVRWLLLKSWREKPAEPQNSTHLHFNVAEGYRNGELGLDLLATYFRQLRERGFKQFHAVVWAGSGAREIERYLRLGFDPYSISPTTVLPEPIFFTCLTRDVPKGERMDRRRLPDPPPLSIVIPAHNEAETLPRLLGSLQKQVLKTFEMVVVADNCTDATAEVAERFGARVVTGSYGSASASRNAGLRAARGDAFLVLDADTEVPEDLTFRVAEAIRKGAAVGAPKLFARERLSAKLFVVGQNLFSGLLGTYGGSAIFFTRRAHEAGGGYDENLKWGEDIEMSLRLGRCGRRTPLPCRVLYNERKWQNNGTWRENWTRLKMTLLSTPRVLKALFRNMRKQAGRLASEADSG
ncbi:MAG: GNAT family N-acetyltransferase [Fimbriimonadaceae bacterium]